MTDNIPPLDRAADQSPASDAAQPTDPNALPPEVIELLDEASVDGGPYSARPMLNSIQLIETTTRRVVREIPFPNAFQILLERTERALAAEMGEQPNV